MKTIFISSTFKDMHFERDIIHEKVMPELNEYAARYGESVSFCDLRWGVNTGDLENEEGSKKVLSVCLDEIDRCRPYMIVILGERYGWIPEEELIADAVQAKRDFALDELEKSVTALEIEYGALSRPEQLERTLFYFRDFTDDEFPGIYRKEDDRHEEKLSQLKQRIRKLTGGRVKHYTVGWDAGLGRVTGLDAFVELVTQDVKGLMEQDWQEYAKLTPFERDQRAQWDVARQKSGQFAARETLVDAYVEKLKAGQPLLALKGAAGSGKSTLMARLAVRLSEDGEQVLPVFCGHTAMSNDALDIITYLVYDLEERLGLPHLEKLSAGKESEDGSEEPGGQWNTREAAPNGQCESGNSVEAVLNGQTGQGNAVEADGPGGQRNAVEAVPGGPEAGTPEQEAADHREAGQENQVQLFTARLAELVAAYGASGGKRLIILLDALDQLMEDETRDRLFFIPPNLSSKVQMVISCLDTFSLPGIGAAETEQVASLADADRREVICGITAFLGRELEDVVVERMAKKSASGSPLYLSLLIQRLLMMNKHDFDEITAGGDGMAAITAHQLGLLDEADDTLEGVCVDILEAASARIGGGFVKAAARYIAVSRHGLRESDIEALLAGDGVEYNSLDFSLFIRYMRSFFLLRDDGRYDFAHRSIREGILADCRADAVPAGASGSAVMESGKDPLRVLHKKLLAHLDGLKEDDPVRIREITYHACMAGDREFLVRYLSRYEAADSDPLVKEILTAAAKDVRDRSLADGGTFLVSILEHRELPCPGRELLLFVNYELDEEFDVSQKELETEKRIATAAIGLARELLEKNGTDQSRRDLTTCFYTLGEIYSSLGENEALKQTIRMYEEALSIREELYEKKPGVIRKKALAYAQTHMADVCKMTGSAAGWEKAVELYRRALALREEIASEEPLPINDKRLASACENLGDINRNLETKESLEEAYQLYQRALKIRERLLEEENTAGNRWLLADTLKGIGRICQKTGGRQMCRLAEKYYLRAQEIYVQTDNLKRTVQSRVDVAQIYMQRGRLCETEGSRSALLAALEHCKAAMAISEQLMREMNTAYFRDDMARMYLNAAVVRKNLRDQESLAEALVWCEKAEALSQKLAEELKSAGSRELLADVWTVTADVCRMMDGQKYCEKALGLYERVLTLREELVKERKTAGSREDLATTLKGIGHLLLEMGRTPEEYLAYLEREQELLKELDSERGTDRSRERLADGYYQLAQAYLHAGGEARIRLAEQMCREGIRLQEQTAARQNTVSGWEMLLILYLQMGKICNASGGRSSGERALKFLKKALAAGEHMSAEGGIRASELLGMVYKDLGDTYFMLGADSDLQRSRDMFQKACEISGAAAEETGMPASREQFANACYGQATACLAMQSETERGEAERLLLQSVEISERLAEELGTAGSRDLLAAARLKLGGFYAQKSAKEHLERAEEYDQLAFQAWRQLEKEGYCKVAKLGLPACAIALSDLYERMGGEERRKKALEMATYARERYEGNLKEHRSVLNLRKLAAAWRRTGDLLMASGGMERLEQAFAAYQKAYALCSDKEAEPETRAGREELAQCQTCLGVLYESCGDRVHMQQAFAAYQEAYALRKENLREDDGVQTVLDAVFSCRKLGKAYYRLERESDLKEALTLHEEERELLFSHEEQIGPVRLRGYLTGMYEHLGNLLRRMGGAENLVRAREAYEQYLAIAKEEAEDSALPQDMRDIAVAYEKIGDIYMDIGTTTDIEDAARMFELERDVWEQLAGQLGRPDYLRGIAIAWQKLGTAYKALDGEEAARQAAACIGQALTFWEQLREETGLIQNERDIAVCYERLGDLKKNEGGAEAGDEALAYYVREEEIWRRLLEALDTADVRRGLSIALGKQADLIRERAGEEHRLRAAALYRQKLEYDRQLAEDPGTADARKRYAICCRKLGKACADGDRRAEKEEALGLYRAYISLATGLLAEGVLDETDNGLCAAWQTTASLYRALGGEHASEQVRTAYENALAYVTQGEGDAEECAEDRVERMKLYSNFASACMEQGTEEVLEKAFPYSREACRIAEDFAENHPSAEHSDHFALCLMNHGRLCAAAGEAYAEESIDCYRRAVAMAETVVDEADAVYASQVLTVCSMSLGDLLKTRDSDSEESLDYYRKGLAYGSRFAAKHATVANLDNYVVALYKVIIHTGTPVEEKYELAEQMLAISEQLHARTGNPRHKRFADIAAELMEILTGEDEDAEDGNETDADAGNDADEADVGED